MALTSGLLAYWSLDEASGNAADATGNGHTMTNTGSAAFAPGLINNGIDFGSNNTTKYFSQGSDLGITGGAISLSGWIKIGPANENGENGNVLYQADAGTNVEFSINASGVDATHIQWVIQKYAPGGSGSSSFAYVSGSQVIDSNWHHLVLTYDGTNWAAYVDGVQVQTGTSTGNGSGSHGMVDGTAIGTFLRDLTDKTNGQVDECGIWNRALTSLEVTQLYNGGHGLAYPLVPASPSGGFFAASR